jgi:hypothetical protein
MIEDMASLKQAMEEMDAQDPAVAEAAKNRAAQILGASKLSFSKIAELIEQRRLLLRPRIVASIKRMDQPEMLGEAAFLDAGSALRREGQSFRQIAEALELNGGLAPQRAEAVPVSEPRHQLEMVDELATPAWLSALDLFIRIVFFPLRHPLRFFTIAVLAFVLFNTLRGFMGFGQQVSGFVDSIAGARQRVDKVVSSVSSFVDKWISRQSQETAAPPASPAPIPSPSASVAAPSPIPSAVPTAALASPAPAPAPSANETAPPAAPSAAAPAAPPVSTPFPDTRGAPSAQAAKDLTRTARRAFEDLMSAAGFRRNSRQAGPCIGGVGGCYWGGGRY